MINSLLAADGVDGVVNDAVRFKDKLWDWFTNTDMWATVLFSGIRILLIFILTRVIIKVVSNVIDRSLERETRGGC